MMLPENELPLFERPAAATDIYIYIYIYIYTLTDHLLGIWSLVTGH